MSLGYDLALALPGLRAQAESRMTDSVRVTRETVGEGVDEDGNPVVESVTLYEGKCRFVTRVGGAGGVRSVDAVSQLIAVQAPELHVPVVGTGGIRNDDRFEILSSVGDPELVGQRGVVSGMFQSSQATARRLPVEVWS